MSASADLLCSHDTRSVNPVVVLILVAILKFARRFHSVAFPQTFIPSVLVLPAHVLERVGFCPLVCIGVGCSIFSEKAQYIVHNSCKVLRYEGCVAGRRMLPSLPFDSPTMCVTQTVCMPLAQGMCLPVNSKSIVNLRFPVHGVTVVKMTSGVPTPQDVSYSSELVHMFLTLLEFSLQRFCLTQIGIRQLLPDLIRPEVPVPHILYIHTVILLRTIRAKVIDVFALEIPVFIFPVHSEYQIMHLLASQVVLGHKVLDHDHMTSSRWQIISVMIDVHSLRFHLLPVPFDISHFIL